MTSLTRPEAMMTLKEITLTHRKTKQLFYKNFLIHWVSILIIRIPIRTAIHPELMYTRFPTYVDTIQYQARVLLLTRARRELGAYITFCLNILSLLTVKPLAKRTRKTTQVCKTRTCVRTCERWPNGFASRLASRKKP